MERESNHTAWCNPKNCTHGDNYTRWKCEHCGGDSSYDHDFCDVILAREAEIKFQREQYLIEENPWLVKFANDFAIWQKRHPNSRS